MGYIRHSYVVYTLMVYIQMLPTIKKNLNHNEKHSIDFIHSYNNF